MRLCGECRLLVLVLHLAREKLKRLQIHMFKPSLLPLLCAGLLHFSLVCIVHPHFVAPPPPLLLKRIVSDWQQGGEPLCQLADIDNNQTGAGGWKMYYKLRIGGSFSGFLCIMVWWALMLVALNECMNALWEYNKVPKFLMSSELPYILSVQNPECRFCTESWGNTIIGWEEGKARKIVRRKNIPDTLRPFSPDCNTHTSYREIMPCQVP